MRTAARAQRSRVAIVVAVAAALVAAGKAQAAARFEPGPCPTSAARSFPADLKVDCGVLVVPENRSRPGSRSIRLEVAIMRSRAAKPAKDPILFIQGGPSIGAIVPQLA